MSIDGPLKSTYIVNEDGLRVAGGRWLLQGGGAIKVTGYTSDNIGSRRVVGGDALPIYVLGEDDIRPRGGTFRLKEGQPIPITNVIAAARGVKHGAAVPVYPVDANGNYDPLFNLPIFGFDLGLQTFTAYMAKRAGQGPFAAAPIVQGKWDTTGTGDSLTFPRGDLIGNQTQLQYANFDPYQGSVVFWITPEWDGDDGLYHYIVDYGSWPNDLFIYKHSDNNMYFTIGGEVTSAVDISAWTAGTTYCVVIRWDQTNTLDGTNYTCNSVNDVHTFSIAAPITAQAPNANPILQVANAIVEGFTVYRRPLTDGTYGVRPMNGNQYSDDEINAIYAAGAGRGPTLVTGSEDVCFCLPTNSTEEILATGTGEAWSWPWTSNLLDVWGMWDGGLPGTDRAVEYNGTTTSINCGSDVDIDDIQDAEFTAEAWVRVDARGAVSSFIFSKAKWNLLYTGTELIADVDCATDDALSIISASNIPVDGKWHHYTMYFDDAGDRKIYLAVDGVWAASYDTQDAGNGAIVTDAGDDLIIGNRAAADRAIDGAIAWAAISNNDRHTAGTDFIPPRAFPADDANYLASWPMDEGTGATIDNIGDQGGAGSGAANRDGTLANGSWSSIWEQDATPVIPQSLEFFNENDGIDFGSGANIDDLPTADCTIEFYGRLPKDVPNNTEIFAKCDAGRANGWTWYYIAGDLWFYGTWDGTDINFALGAYADDRNHHFALDWDVGTLTARFFVDGILVGTDVAVGNYEVDAANDCILNGRNAVGTVDSKWASGWIRLSDNRRYTGNNFVPPARTNPPANDGNAQLLINMDDGAGTTATDSSGNGYDGTITFGATTRWNNTPDMAIDEPGAAIYGPKGYNLGVDAADEGMYIEQTVVAETDYVVFPVISIGESGRARPVIRIYDVSNAADVVSFNGPELHGVDAGAGNAAVLTVATARWIADALIGATVYNITDGSSATITDNSETVVTGALSGGTDDDWDIGDEYVIRFPRGYCEWPWQESFCFQTPAGCTLLRVFIENESADGVMQVHQVQVMPNLTVNGDMESLTGANPDIITGWTNSGLDAGDTESSAGGNNIIHSGAEAIQFNAGAATNEGMYVGITLDTGRFLAVGIWLHTDGDLTGFSSTRLIAHNSLSDAFTLTQNQGAQWQYMPTVARRGAGAGRIFLKGSTATSYADDVYAVLLNDVSLTATPASQANSLEAGGIRVDGRDTCTQPITTIRADAGRIECNARPRHSTALAASFGQTTEFIFDAYEDANNYIRCWRTANNVHIEYNAQAAGAVTGAWNSTGAWNADADLEIRVLYSIYWARLYINGVLQLELAGPCVFATDFTQPINWGQRQDGAMQFDGVIS